MAKQEYPKWLFHASQPATKVQDAEAHALLGEGWEETPVVAPTPMTQAQHDASTDPNKPALVAPAGQPPPPVDPVAPPVAPTAEAETAAPDEAAELYAAPAAAITKKLKGCSKDVLEKILRFEMANPAGARAGLVKSVKAALAKVSE